MPRTTLRQVEPCDPALLIGWLEASNRMVTVTVSPKTNVVEGGLNDRDTTLVWAADGVESFEDTARMNPTPRYAVPTTIFCKIQNIDDY